MHRQYRRARGFGKLDKARQPFAVTNTLGASAGHLTRGKNNHSFIIVEGVANTADISLSGLTTQRIHRQGHIIELGDIQQ